jgi:hypothetical protein
VLRLHLKSSFGLDLSEAPESETETELPASIEHSNSTFSCRAAFTTLTVSEFRQKGTAVRIGKKMFLYWIVL